MDIVGVDISKATSLYLLDLKHGISAGIPAAVRPEP